MLVCLANVLLYCFHVRFAGWTMLSFSPWGIPLTSETRTECLLRNTCFNIYNPWNIHERGKTPVCRVTQSSKGSFSTSIIVPGSVHNVLPCNLQRGWHRVCWWKAGHSPRVKFFSDCKTALQGIARRISALSARANPVVAKWGTMRRIQLGSYISTRVCRRTCGLKKDCQRKCIKGSKGLTSCNVWQPQDIHVLFCKHVVQAPFLRELTAILPSVPTRELSETSGLGGDGLCLWRFDVCNTYVMSWASFPKLYI